MSEKIFLNHTNHPSSKWGIEQISAAKILGDIVDFPFPNIPPQADEIEIKKFVEENLREILNFSPAFVLCQGEFNYTFEMVTELKKNNISVVAATSERTVSTVIEEDGSSRSISTFRFVRFRSY